MKLSLYGSNELYIGNLGEVHNAVHTEEINGENVLDFTTFQQVYKKDRIMYKDNTNAWHEFVVDGVVANKENGKIVYDAYAEHSIYETFGDYIKTLDSNTETAKTMLGQVLAPSRWEVGTVTVQGTRSYHFYQMSVMEAIQEMAKLWECEVRYRIERIGNDILKRYVDLVPKRGVDLGKRFTYSKDILAIQKTIQPEPVVTALYGYGKQLDVIPGEEDMPQRRISLETVTDGRGYVEDDIVRAQYGRGPADDKHHNFDKVIFNDCEDVDELLVLTTEEFEKRKKPKVTYETTVIDLKELGYEHEGTSLGDAVAVIDKDFSPELRLKSRVIRIERDLLSPDENKLTFGTFTPSLTNNQVDISEFMDNFRERSGIWDRAEVINPDGTIDIDWFENIIKGLNQEMNARGGYVYFSDQGDGIMTLDAPIDGNPTMAIQIKGGMFRIAGSKLPNGEWDWRTFGDGKGFYADAFVGGVLKGGQVEFDLTMGTLLIGNDETDYVLYWDGHSLKFGDGALGDLKGDKGEQGISNFIHTAWADDENGLNFTTVEPGPRKWIGTTVSIYDTPPELYYEYDWVKQGAEDGEDGDAGESPIYMLLTNENHVVPTDHNGNYGNYAGATSTLKIYVGTEDQTNQWSYKITPGPGVTGIKNVNTYSVTGMTEDVGTVLFTANKVGYPNYEKTFKVTKSRRAKEGVDGVGIASYIEQYAISEFNVGQKSDSWLIANLSWSPTALSPTKEKPYLWNYELLQYTHGLPNKSELRVIAVFSEDGEDGRGLTNTKRKYKLNNSHDTPPAINSTWLDAPVETNNSNKFLWCYEIYTWSKEPLETTGTPFVLTAQGQAAPNMMSQYSQINNTQHVNWHYPFETGDLYMRTSIDGGETWSDPMKIIGEDGSNGAYREFQFALGTGFAVTGSWSDGPPTVVPDGRFVWLRSRNVAGNGTPAAWSTPIRLTGETGDDGIDSTSYWLVIDSPAIKHVANGIFEPSTIVIKAKSKTGENAPILYDGRYRITESVDGITWTPGYESGAMESTVYYEPHVNADTKFINVQLYGWSLDIGDWDEIFLLDEEQIVVLQDGKDGEDGEPGDKGEPGDSVGVQYSYNESGPWVNTYVTGHKYMRQRVGTGNWTGAIKILGEDGDKFLVEYSIDGETNWHKVWVFEDIYMRTKVGANPWQGPMKIVGNDGFDGDILMMEYSITDQGPWHITFEQGDNYMRQRVTPNDWGAPIKITADEIYIQYSSRSNMWWEDVFDPATHKFMRQRIGRNGVWSEAMKIIGEDGVSNYTYVRYSSYADGSYFNEIAAGKEYFGVAVTTSTVPPTDKGLYKWSKFKGEPGQPGSIGPPGDTGPNGPPGAALELQYSINGSTSWHAVLSPNDKYMRQKLSNTSIWSNAIKIVGEDANLLPWVQDWNSNLTVINGRYVLTPNLFAGTTHANGKKTGVFLGYGLETGHQGLVGYEEDVHKATINGAEVFFQTQNFLLELTNSEGEVISSMTAANQGFQQMHVDKFTSPSVVQRDTDGGTFYVNYMTGDDQTGNGTSSRPYGTIDGVWEHLGGAKYLNEDVYIIMSSDYHANIRFEGFTGPGEIRIAMGSREITDYITIRGCTNKIKFENFVLNYTQDNSIDRIFEINNCNSVELSNFTIKGNGKIQKYMQASNGSNVFVSGGSCYGNTQDGFVALNNSHIFIWNTKGTSARYSLRGTYGGMVGRGGTTLSGAVSTWNGGIDYGSATVDSGTAPSPPSSGAVKTASFSSSWCDSYRYGQGWRNENEATQGNYGYGANDGLWGFNFATLRAASDLKQMRITLTRLNKGGQAGPVPVYLYLHNYTSKPGGVPSLVNVGNIGSLKWGETKTFTLSNTVMSRIRNGTSKGFAIRATSRAAYSKISAKATVVATYS